MDEKVSIGKFKRKISELVNRVAFGGERIVLTSRAKPKAALVSIEDYERLRILEVWGRGVHIRSWISEVQKLSDAVHMRREGQEIDVDRLLSESRRALEERNDWAADCN